MNGRKLMVLLIAVLALLAAGCGGNSKSEATPATVETTVETDTVATDTNVAEDTTATDTGGSGIDTSALGGKCAEFAGISTKLAQSLSGQTADLQQASKLFDEIADQVPDEIKADYQVIAENFKKLAEALKGVDLTSGETPSPEALAKIQEVTASMDSAEVRQATQHIEAWVKKNC